ncbi:BON domain-containing protein [Streptomyces sp. NPDC001553]|uniref:BON domain-containing protein n=1 Tax=Streptomyces sp. NPDC001553 TaxID=3154385 RepID=UPI003320B8D6
MKASCAMPRASRIGPRGETGTAYTGRHQARGCRSARRTRRQAVARPRLPTAAGAGAGEVQPRRTGLSGPLALPPEPAPPVHLDCSVEEGVVTLRGSLHNRALAPLVARAARAVEGIVDVRMELTGAAGASH